MYNNIANVVKRRLIRELQDSFSRHPRYSKIVPFIQNKFSYEEVPQFSIVVKGSSSTKQQLASDNFVGTVISYCQLARVSNKSGQAVEWIREDTQALRENNGVFQSPPGLYYIDLIEDDQFMVDPLLQVKNKVVFETVTGTETGFFLPHAPIFPNSFFLFRDDRVLLVSGVHYSIDLDTGEITFLIAFPINTVFRASYFYPVASRGPFQIRQNTFDNKAIPGVVLAFGRRNEKGDKQAVFVSDVRQNCVHEYGGHWEMSFSFDVAARDPLQQEEITDYILMTLWGEKKNRLELEGITLLDISFGGEAEEEYDETTGELWFTASLDVSFQTDWSIHVPIPFTISMVDFLPSGYNQASFAGLTDQEAADVSSSLRVVPVTSPFLPKAGRLFDFERIS